MVAGGYPEEDAANDSRERRSQSKAHESEDADADQGEEPTIIKCARSTKS